jgi:DNA-binding Xre family transcriptional regulator
MTAWTDFVKEWAKKKGLSYGCALSKPECSAEYRKKNPTKKQEKEKEKEATEKMGMEDVDVPESKKKRGRKPKYATEEERKKAKLVMTVASNKKKRQEKKEMEGKGAIPTQILVEQDLAKKSRMKSAGMSNNNLEKLKGDGVMKDKKEEIKTLSNILNHLTEHITDPNEPIDPRDYKQAKEVIDAIKREKEEKMEGGALKKSNYVVQSVIFSKDKWTTPKAKSWLKKHQYKSPKVDKTEEHLRFRQADPDTVEEDGYTEYRTKPLDDSGISLILAYKKRGFKGKGKASEGEGVGSSKVSPPPLHSNRQIALPPPPKKLTKIETTQFVNEILLDLRNNKLTKEDFYKRMEENYIPPKKRLALLRILLSKRFVSEDDLINNNIYGITNQEIAPLISQIKSGNYDKRFPKERILKIIQRARFPEITEEQRQRLIQAAISSGLLTEEEIYPVFANAPPIIPGGAKAEPKPILKKKGQVFVPDAPAGSFFAISSNSNVAEPAAAVSSPVINLKAQSEGLPASYAEKPLMQLLEAKSAPAGNGVRKRGKGLFGSAKKLFKKVKKGTENIVL